MRSSYWQWVERQDTWGSRQRVRTPMFWVSVPVIASLTALATVLADASFTLYAAYTIAGTALLMVMLSFALPRPQWKARHNHWIFVGLSAVSLVAALVVHLAR